MTLPRYQATRYVVPLREGGSLPAVVDTAAGGLFVAKFRGAGQGEAALPRVVSICRGAPALKPPAAFVPGISRTHLP